MTALFRTAGLAMILLVAACASNGSTPTAFGPQSQTALLVLAGPKFPFAANTGFRRVDLGAGTFQPEYVGFGTGIVGGQINREGPVYFNVREVQAGDYALVSLLAVPGTAQVWTCMPAGGPVFTLRPGQVAVVRSDPFWVGGSGVPRPAAVSDDDVLRAFETARAAHPGLVGDARVSAPVATIRWESGGVGMTRNCSESPTFTRIR